MESMQTNAEVDFVISADEMEILNNVNQIEHNGEHIKFAVICGLVNLIIHLLNIIWNGV